MYASEAAVHSFHLISITLGVHVLGHVNYYTSSKHRLALLQRERERGGEGGGIVLTGERG